MDSKYDPKKIEEKWQKYWEKHPELCSADDESKKEKKFIMVEFPYPSGDGLHVGHVRSYTALDVYSRKLRMQGFNVLYPIGWDAFGLPTENYAIKHKIHPSIATKKNIATFRKQMQRLGLSYDWSREINTTNPKYYKWTQWIFLKLLENKLAYKAKMPINWCPNCKIGLANEEVINGKCERCGTPVEKREKEQWLLAITKYANRLIDDLETVDYSNKIKNQQINWIGRSEGTVVKFPIKPSPGASRHPLPPADDGDFIEVFTTRLDTIYGCTYMVIAPEHEIISNLKCQISNFKEVEEYIENTKKKTDLARMESKEKTGVKLKGIKVMNPFNNEEIPVFVADYVLAQYGTGAVMAVPAHDERDFEFAKKYNLPIVQSIAPNLEDYKQSLKVLETLKKIYDGARKRNLQFWLSSGLACMFYAKMIYRKIGDIDIVVKNEEEQTKFAKYLEEIGFKKTGEKTFSKKYVNFVFENKDGMEVDLGVYAKGLELGERGFRQKEKELNGCKTYVLSKHFNEELKESLSHDGSNGRDKNKDIVDLKYLEGKAYEEDGHLVNSEKYSGLSSKEARKKMTAWLEKNNLGTRKINYHLRDWIFSRQHYWGEPIPVILCKKCGIIPVSEENLPVELPMVESYEPTDTGESPLAKITNWVNVSCPKCKSPARRETDTMPNWAGSSWYFLRYVDPNNDKELASQEKLKYWMPVNLYNGGMEHTTLHLLYSRFWNKFLFDIGISPVSEPYAARRSHGIVLAEDGRKMSKSFGNVINPDEIADRFGADTLRIYEMFMGPFSDAIPWSTTSIVGVFRFLEKVWRLKFKVKSSHAYRQAGKLKVTVQNSKLNSLINKTIKKVSGDIDNLRFNTAVSALMILTNEMDREKELPIASYELLITILAPFAPHISEELWSKLGYKKSIFLETWPKYDPKFIKDEEIELVIQVNGKVRDRIKVSADLNEEEAKKLALESEKIKLHVADKKIRKVIYIKGRLVSIVI